MLLPLWFKHSKSVEVCHALTHSVVHNTTKNTVPFLHVWVLGISLKLNQAKVRNEARSEEERKRFFWRVIDMDPREWYRREEN